MAPAYIKGGVWTNVEDEILRAAISKYGLNQWARVSSLLARKTAKQAKARWNEWLDPSIKKVEWSREEDEKLLHLAKIMPTQWRSIAPLVGRTANQCIERYQKLLDDAEEQMRGGEGASLGLTGVGAEASGPAVSTSGDGFVRRQLQPGEIDTIPESRPALPDQVDMDEDEKEMLSEARARLANTQGKKAKRKDRERLLEESRRLALVQKRRQLKQAGINTKLRSKQGMGIDYNADIPFEHKPAPGFYDTAEEKDANARTKEKFDAIMEKRGIRKNEKEKSDQEKRKREPEESAAQLAVRAQKLQQLSQADQVSKRRRLVLPEPQVADSEIEQVVKQTRRGEQLATDGDAQLLQTGGYSDDFTPSTVPTTASVPQKSSILQASQDLINLTNSQSSLLGHENTPLHSSFSSQKESFLPPQTPNTVLQTRRRDMLGVNAVGADATPREVIRRGFQGLPKPKNEFEIVVPETQEDVEPEEVANGLEEDAAERDRRLQAQRDAELQQQLARRSQVLQKNLPRPAEVSGLQDVSLFKSCPKELEDTIRAELVMLIHSDNVKYPTDSDVRGPQTSHGTVDDLDDTVKAQVLRDIAEEAGPMPAPATEENEIPVDLSFLSSDEFSSHLARLAEKSNKQEKKLSLVLGGYIKRQGTLRTKFVEATAALQTARNELTAFSVLDDMESIAASNRSAVLQEQVDFLTDSERKAQDRYRELQAVRNSLNGHSNGY